MRRLLSESDSEEEQLDGLYSSRVDLEDGRAALRRQPSERSGPAPPQDNIDRQTVNGVRVAAASAGGNEGSGYGQQEDEDPVVEIRVHIHEAKELAAKDGSSSDPYVFATCCGEERRTQVAPPGLDALWDEELQFFETEVRWSQLRGEQLTVQVWDHDTMTRDDMIGAFTFDLDNVRAQESKEYYRSWVTLYNAQNDSVHGAQGQLLVSITLLEPGDELPRRPGHLVHEGDVSEVELNVELYRADGVPRMDKGVFGGGKADPYVSLAWSGQKARSTHRADTFTPEFYEGLKLSVLVEQRADAPPRSDVVIVRLREHNKSLAR